VRSVLQPSELAVVARACDLIAAHTQDVRHVP
jgi:hypothetical protein